MNYLLFQYRGISFQGEFLKALTVGSEMFMNYFYGDLVANIPPWADAIAEPKADRNIAAAAPRPTGMNCMIADEADIG